MKHSIPTAEELRCQWLEQSELYVTSKTLRENAIEPNKRYEEKERAAKKQAEFLVNLFIELYPEELEKINKKLEKVSTSNSLEV